MSASPLAALAAAVRSRGESSESQVIADALRANGVSPGTRVAFIGSSFDAYWARLARVRIVAESPDTNYVDREPAEQARGLGALARSSAAAVVMRRPRYANSAEWRQLGPTAYYLLRF